MRNEFEKQVQEKMEELHLVPSPPVWQKIEEQIRPKKDRRKIILWVFLLGVLLTGTIFWLTRPESKHSIADKTVSRDLPLPEKQNPDATEQTGITSSEKEMTDKKITTKQQTTATDRESTTTTTMAPQLENKKTRTSDQQSKTNSLRVNRPVKTGTVVLTS